MLEEKESIGRFSVLPIVFAKSKNIIYYGKYRKKRRYESDKHLQKAMFIEVLEDKKDKNKFCYYGKYRKKRINFNLA